MPDEIHEAMRDLVRARESAAEDQRHKRQLISAFLLRHGRIYHRTKTWTMRYRRWLQRQSFDHPAQQVALQEMVLAERHAVERVARLTTGIKELVTDWQLGPVVEALQALRGVALISAVTFMAEIGDVCRFEDSRKLMADLGLVPSEYSTGQTVIPPFLMGADSTDRRNTFDHILFEQPVESFCRCLPTQCLSRARVQ